MDAIKYTAAHPTTDWAEVESEVCCPGHWFVLAIGTFFLLAGIVAFLAIAQAVPPGFPVWIAKLGTIIFGALGGSGVVYAARVLIFPAHVRHASHDDFPDVPREPLVREGSIVNGRVTHELVEEKDQWLYRPNRTLWRHDKAFLIGFGVPFLLGFAAVWTWVLHSQLNFAGWLVSAICATAMTLACGGSVLVLFVMMYRSNYGRLCNLTIPRNGDDIDLDSAEDPDPEKTDLATGLKWAFLGESKRHRTTIPRDFVGAVQLCPWEYVMGERTGRSTTWAVQGLLVLRNVDEGACHRLPILLTNDFVGAARLMRRLADTLNVPYLFSADAKGWAAERIRAKSRRPLSIGGMLS